MILTLTQVTSITGDWGTFTFDEGDSAMGTGGVMQTAYLT